MPTQIHGEGIGSRDQARIADAAMSIRDGNLIRSGDGMSPNK